MKFLEVLSPKSVEDLLKQDVKQAEKQIEKYREAIKDVQEKIKALTTTRREVREQVAELDNKILACADEADRLMTGMTDVLKLVEKYKNL